MYKCIYVFYPFKLLTYLFLSRCACVYFGLRLPRVSTLLLKSPAAANTFYCSYIYIYIYIHIICVQLICAYKTELILVARHAGIKEGICRSRTRHALQAAPSQRSQLKANMITLDTPIPPLHLMMDVTVFVNLLL